MKTAIGKFVNKILTFLVGAPIYIEQPRQANGRFVNKR
jgi:hypothetical protein